MKEQGCRRAFLVLLLALGRPKAASETGPGSGVAAGKEQRERNDTFLGDFLFDCDHNHQRLFLQSRLPNLKRSSVPLDAVKVMTTMLPNIDRAMMPDITRGAIWFPKTSRKKTVAMSSSPSSRWSTETAQSYWSISQTLISPWGCPTNICDIHKDKQAACQTLSCYGAHSKGLSGPIDFTENLSNALEGFSLVQTM